MSATSVKSKVQNLLWAVSGGRCEYEGCNKLLHTDILTQKKYNTAYIAHIVGDKPDGPRGDQNRSALLSNEIENLMLLCDAHHTLIDRQDVEGHTETRLLEMKRKHENRIELLTSIAPNFSSEILIFGANIGSQNSPLSHQTAAETIVPEYYPASRGGIELGMKNSALVDCSSIYWESEVDNLCLQFAQKVKPKMMQGNDCHYSVFALAPQPLLIRFGVLLNDLNNVRVFQKHREPSTWKWLHHETGSKYVLKEPAIQKQTPVLVLSLSATITHDRIKSVLGEDVSVWEITIDNPNNDFLKTEQMLSEFRKISRSTFNIIKKVHGNVDLHVFPAMPVSAAVEFGRVWMPKADLPLIIYDQNKQVGGFMKTITIN